MRIAEALFPAQVAVAALFFQNGVGQMTMKMVFITGGLAPNLRVAPAPVQWILTMPTRKKYFLIPATTYFRPQHSAARIMPVHPGALTS